MWLLVWNWWILNWNTHLWPKLNFLLGVLGLMARCFHRIYMAGVSIYAIYAPPPKMVFQPTKGSGCLTGLTLSHPYAIYMLVLQNINLQIFWGQRLKFQEWENLAGHSGEPYIPSKLPLSFIMRSSDHSIWWWLSYIVIWWSWYHHVWKSWRVNGSNSPRKIPPLPSDLTDDTKMPFVCEVKRDAEVFQKFSKVPSSRNINKSAQKVSNNGALTLC